MAIGTSSLDIRAETKNQKGSFMVSHGVRTRPCDLAEDAWQVTRRLSPRPNVRVATVDSSGQTLNLYAHSRRLDADAPEKPWAMYLADDQRRYHFLCFDLDSKTREARTGAERDANLLTDLLSRAGIASITCESGPSGGRHVWAALKESIDAETIATLGRLARHMCPTLDLSPLLNATTGCVRPPGAPHRSGGRSTIIRGELDTLTEPTATAHQVRQLIETLAATVTSDPVEHIDTRTPLPLDDHGRLYLPGSKRSLPANSAAALEEDAASGDASAVLWRILIGAAAARWHHADIAALVEHSPGLEHIRSRRDGDHRTPRGASEATKLLRRQWDKAVRYVATTPRQIGNDPTFDARADAIAAHVRTLQTRANASAGRWTRGGGPADRRVLDILCILALQALKTTVEADIRRLALLAGIGRETARVALLRLMEDDWISQAQAADGPHGAHWKIGPQIDIHRELDITRSQADPRPEGAGSAERIILLTQLTNRRDASTHDIFTHSPGLGHLAGNIFAHTSRTPQTGKELSTNIGLPATTLLSILDRLTDVGLLIRASKGYQRRSTDRRDAVATRLGVSGRLNERAHRYRIERELWAWWQAEQDWMHAPRRSNQRRTPRGQLSLLPQFGTNAYGAHPRCANGKLDWGEARRIIERERSEHAHRHMAGIHPEAAQRAG